MGSLNSDVIWWYCFGVPTNVSTGKIKYRHRAHANSIHFCSSSRFTGISAAFRFSPRRKVCNASQRMRIERLLKVDCTQTMEIRRFRAYFVRVEFSIESFKCRAIGEVMIFISDAIARFFFQNKIMWKFQKLNKHNRKKWKQLKNVQKNK